MITLRLTAAALIAVVFAACSGGSVATTPVSAATAAATASATATPAPTSATLGVGATTAQALPVANGATATVSIASSGAPAGATVLVTASTAPPAGISTIAAFRRSAQAITRTALAYYTFVPSVDIQLTNLPTITISFPTNIVGPDVQIHEAFLDASTQQPVYTYDIANGKSGATFTATPLAPKILAGKSYIFVFYLETGTAATPAPGASATATASASATATPSAAPTVAPTANAAEVTVPATISNAAVGINYTSDPNFFTGLAGTHVFGRGGLASFNGGTPALVTDCRIVLGAGSATISGGGVTVTAPYISSNPSVQTAVIGSPDSLHVGGIEQITMYDANGSAIGLFFAAGRLTAATGGKTGVSLVCSGAYGTSITTDRSLDTLVFSPATIATLMTRAGSANPSTIGNIVTGDLGGASGTVAFGRGTLTTSGGATTVVTDCALNVTGGTVTLTGGTFSNSASFTGASIDKVQVVSVQGSPTQFAFQPQNGKVLMIVNNFGYVQKAQSVGSDLSQLVCPL